MHCAIAARGSPDTLHHAQSPDKSASYTTACGSAIHCAIELHLESPDESASYSIYLRD